MKIAGVLLIALLLGVSLEAHATIYKANFNVIGQVTMHKVEEEETLYTIARDYNLGIIEVIAANPDVDVMNPKVGYQLTLPTMYILPAHNREEIVINLSELRLFYYYSPDVVITFL